MSIRECWSGPVLADPPSSSFRRHIDLPEFDRAVELMRENPGEWVLVTPALQTISVWDFREHVRAGRVSLPDGIWEFAPKRVRSKPHMRRTDEHHLYARFMGLHLSGGAWLVPGRVAEPLVRIVAPETAPSSDAVAALIGARA